MKVFWMLNLFIFFLLFLFQLSFKYFFTFDYWSLGIFHSMQTKLTWYVNLKCWKCI
jgi:hypothetical protein